MSGKLKKRLNVRGTLSFKVCTDKYYANILSGNVKKIKRF